MAKVCIICEKEPQGKAYRVQDDFVIKAIRWGKQKLGIAKNNELFVDEGCLPAYREKRKRFERNVVFYVAIGVIIFVLINGIQVLYGRFSFVTFLASVLLAILVSGLAILNYATPPIEEPRGVLQPQSAAPAGKEEKAKMKKPKKR